MKKQLPSSSSFHVLGCINFIFKDEDDGNKGHVDGWTVSRASL